MQLTFEHSMRLIFETSDRCSAPSRTVCGGDTPQSIASSMDTSCITTGGRGSARASRVEPRGFKPLTSCMPCQHSSGPLVVSGIPCFATSGLRRTSSFLSRNRSNRYGPANSYPVLGLCFSGRHHDWRASCDPQLRLLVCSSTPGMTRLWQLQKQTELWQGLVLTNQLISCILVLVVRYGATETRS